MRRIPILLLLAACSGKLATTSSGDTGPSAEKVCAGLTSTTTPGLAPTSTPVFCPGGGTFEDLRLNLAMLDANGAPCVECVSADLTARVTVINDCAVDLSYRGGCGILEYDVVGPTRGVAMTAECYTTTATTSLDVTVPAGGVVTFEAGVFGLDEGVHTGTFSVHGFDDPLVERFCVDLP